MENKIKKFVTELCKRDGIKDQEIINQKVDKVVSDYKNNNINYQTKLCFHKITRWHAKRLLTTIDDKYCLEYFLLKYILEVLKKQFSRISATDEVTNLLNDLQNIKNNDFTIVKFDFKNYYNNLSSLYIYNKYIYNGIKTEQEKQILQTYFEQVPVCYCGLIPSDYVAAIISEQLSQKLLDSFDNIVGSYHYVDDFVLLFDKHVEKQKVIETIKSCVNQVYYDKTICGCEKNNVEPYLSGKKFEYKTNKDLPFNTGFLGYDLFVKQNNNHLDYEIGISKFSQKLFSNGVKNAIKKYYDQTETLRNIIKIKCKRFVYTKTDDILNKTMTVSDFYNQFYKVIKQKQQHVNDQTIAFLKNAVIDCFIDLKKPLPYYLKDKNPNNGYCLYNNLIKNKAVVLNRKSGLDKKQLISLLSKILPNNNFENMTYTQLKKQYKKIYECNK